MVRDVQNLKTSIERTGFMQWRARVTGDLGGRLPVVWTMFTATRRGAEMASSKLVAYNKGERSDPGAFVFLR